MDIELNLQEQAISPANEEPVSEHDELTNTTAAQEPEGNVMSNNLASAVSTSLEPQPEPRQDVAINIDARFGPSCAPILSNADIVNNIIRASERADRRNWLRLFLCCIPTLAISCVAWIAWATIKCLSNQEDNYSTSQVLYVFGIIWACFTGVIFLWAIYYGVKNYTNAGRYAALGSNVRCIVKLEGDQWTKYVNYLYGPNRDFEYLGAIGGYGHIVFCQRGFILDEMCHIVRNDPHIVLKVTYIVGMGLRVHLIRGDGTYTVSKYVDQAERERAAQAAILQRTVPFDIYLPNTIPQNVALMLGLQLQHGF